MTNEEKEIANAIKEKRMERIELGFCPDCEPSEYLREQPDGVLYCAKCLWNQTLL